MSAERFTLVCSSVATAAGCKAARQHVDLSGAGLMFWFWAQVLLCGGNFSGRLGNSKVHLARIELATFSV